MPRRVALILGCIVASSTAAFAFKPVDRTPTGFEIDMQSAELCSDLAAGSLRGKEGAQIVREKVKTLPGREQERQITMVIRAEPESRTSLDYTFTCHTSHGGDGVLLIDFNIGSIPSFPGR